MNITPEDVQANAHLAYRYRLQQEQHVKRRVLLVGLVTLLLLVLLAGCAGQPKVAALGAMTDGENALLQGRISSFERGKIGAFGAIAAGGSMPRGDKFGEETGPFVPGPDSVLSSKTGSTFMAAGAQGGITYQPHRNVGLLLGLSLWGEQAYDEFRYETPFSGSGRYYQDGGDIEAKVGAVLGVEFFGEKDWTLGVQYDTAVEAVGLSVGFSF